MRTGLLAVCAFLVGRAMLFSQPTSLDSIRHYDVQPLGSYSAIWGYTAPDGREYAILGVNGSSGGTPHPGGTSIIDITNAPVVQQVAFISGPISAWREMKTYRHYAYVVSEGGGGVHIINLSQLPDTAWLVKSFNYVSGTKNTLRSHSISIHDGFMYLNGCANWSPGGILIFDLRNDPENPVFVGQYQPDYIHDSYVLRDTIYASAIYSGGGLYIADATNKASIQTIGLISYTGSGTHNAWVTKDRSHVITTDEIGSTQKNLKFWNISNLPSIPGSPAATYTPSPGEIVHNVTVRGDYAYVAWYTAGVRVVNVTNPASPVNAGGFDTSPLTSGYNGIWGVYPYFPSGKIIAGDIQNGLWVFSFSDLDPRMPVQLLHPAHADSLDLIPTAFRWTKAANLSKDPHYYTISIAGPGVELVANVNDSMYVLSDFTGFQADQTYTWHVRTRDEFNDTASPDTFSFIFAPKPPGVPVQHLPPAMALNQPLTSLLRWHTLPSAFLYHIQLATDSLFASPVQEDSTLVDTLFSTSPLSFNTTYYWRVKATNPAGSSAWTEPRSFTTIPVPPAAPALVSPANNTTGLSLIPMLLWNDVENVTSYRVQVATDSVFTFVVLDQSGIVDTAYVTDSLSYSTPYFWRVRGENAGGSGAFSVVWKFTTINGIPGSPLLVAPKDGSSGLPETLQLIWRTAQYASGYHIQVSADSSFGTLVFEDSSVVDTVVMAGPFTPAVQYYWRVRGFNEDWDGEWSDMATFSVSASVTRSYTLVDGWNLVSLPLTVPDPSVGAVFPDAASALYGFSPATGYFPLSMITAGDGFWLKFNDSMDVALTGAVRYLDSVTVYAGWNLIGTLSEPVEVASLVQIPGGIVASDFFGYNGTYFVADTLVPGQAYWVKCNTSGALVFDATPVGDRQDGRANKPRKQ